MTADVVPRVRPTGWIGALLRQPGLVVSVLIVVVVLGWTLFPEAFTSADPLRAVVRDRLREPGPAHPFGTDQLGRDLFARMVHGTGTTMLAVLIAVSTAVVVGSLIGLLAGFVRRLDGPLMRVVDVLIAVPTLLLSLAIITALGFGTVNVAIAVGAAMVARVARVMRAQVLQSSTHTYVEAAVSCGLRWYTVLLRHVLPFAAGPIAVLATLDVGLAILQVSTLSFLGFGTPPPAPEWGSLVAGGRDYLATAWWLTTLPGLTVVAVVLAVNRIARSLERGDADRWAP